MAIKKEKIKNFSKQIELEDVILFLIPFFIFSLMLVVYFPGILSYDSYEQLSQIKNNVFTNWHPFIHTFIEKICIKIWNSPASIALFQITFFSFIWTIICKYNRKLKKITFIYQLIITLIVSLNPINSIYSITLWKDILFSYLLLFVTFLIQIISDKKFIVSKFLIIVLSFSLFLISALRYNGKIVIIIVVPILIIMFFRKDKKSKNYIFLPLILILFSFCQFCLEKVYNVQDTEKDALSTKIMHVLGAYAYENEISDEDFAVLSKIIDKNDLINRYNPYFSDPIYEKLNIEEYKKSKNEIYKLVIKYFFKNPRVMIKYGLDSTTLVWKIERPNGMIGTIFNTDIYSTNNYDNIKHLNIEKNFYKDVNKVLVKTLNNKYISAILYSVSLYMYFTFALCLILYFKYKNKGILLMTIPNLINILVVALSMPVQDTRYLYPNILIFYLFMIIFIKERTFQNEKYK